MTAEQLLKPRYEVIADYPFNPYQIGDLVQNLSDTGLSIYAKTSDTEYVSPAKFFDKFPHLFRKLNWWENRKAEDMPNQVICKAIPNDTEIIEIEAWDMDILVGWRNKEERTCCSLRSFNPEYGYFPVS